MTDPTKILKYEPGLSMPVMNERLRALVRFGLITRLPKTTTSKAIEYRLTLRGSKVLKTLEIIYQLDDNAPPDHRENPAAQAGRVPPTASAFLSPTQSHPSPSRSKTLKVL